jgi:hypothetical protein
MNIFAKRRETREAACLQALADLLRECGAARENAERLGEDLLLDAGRRARTDLTFEARISALHGAAGVQAVRALGEALAGRRPADDFLRRPVGNPEERFNPDRVSWAEHYGPGRTEPITNPLKISPGPRTREEILMNMGEQERLNQLDDWARIEREAAAAQQEAGAGEAGQFDR